MLHLSYGATNDLLSAVGQCSTSLKELHICYSYDVTDNGLKLLCLKTPEDHILRNGRKLHEMRVRSFHLNPCCETLTSVDIHATSITEYGVAFLLKHISNLKSMGDCTQVTDAIEHIVGYRSRRRSTSKRPRNSR